MKTSELIVLTALMIGLAIFTIGVLLYTRKLMSIYSIDFELQLVVYGLYIIILSIVLAKMLQKVME